MKVNLGNYTWEEVKDLSDKDPVVLLPLGAFEQHGKHLPLKVDEFPCLILSLKCFLQ